MPEKRSGEFLRGLAWNIPASIGAPADLAETVLNLGLAGGGYLGHKLGLLETDQLPQLLEGSPGTTKWWTKGTPMEESADPAFVRGQLTGGLAAAAYGMLPQMRMRQGQVNAITWHGSPHKFDKFDSTKIGTGEGAQAYGHGLYLADNEDTARYYARLGDPRWEESYSVGGRVITASDPEWSMAQAIGTMGRDTYIAKQRAGVEDAVKKLGPASPLTQAKMRVLAKAEAMPEVVRLSKPTEGTNTLYKVDLPDEAIARMLDWDKPLSQQAGMVQKVFDNAWQHSLYRKRTGVDVGDFKGADLVNAMGADSHSRALFADDMRKAGIPGIRYLDGGSRAAGSGSYNYVVFPGEEGMLRILERNGVPLQQGLAEGPVLQKGLARP